MPHAGDATESRQDRLILPLPPSAEIVRESRRQRSAPQPVGWKRFRLLDPKTRPDDRLAALPVCGRAAHPRAGRENPRGNQDEDVFFGQPGVRRPLGGDIPVAGLEKPLRVKNATVR